ncbi:MAG: amino acid permease, partial [Phycisphaerales bacterium]|nr:amino acid permease [Phycisphaerales bacterium]
MNPAVAEPKPTSAARLGTFAGVFTPSILTILGIILFQRLGYIVGAGGLGRTLAIIAAATAISVITSLSLAAIATNMRVKGGGDYYLISRTLGVHFGGAIGLVLFVAQSVSVAFYCIGFGEATAALLGHAGSTLAIALIAGAATLAIGTVAYIGADLATRLQFVVMGALLAALVSFYFGGLRAADPTAIAGAIAAPSHEDSASFWVLFAIFFPAVTGFTQGVSMSGDLRDPAKSLPRGTFWAVGLSTIVYISVAVVLAASMPLAELAGDYRAMRRLAAVPWLIDAGVIAATLSSAMASFLGAPRILQSLARDNVIPPLRVFAVGAGPTDNPRRAVLLAGAVALATMALGNLNTIAALVGMCFLLSYGLLNYATFYEARANSPSFRPRFRYFNAWLSLAGAGLCLFAGVMISPVAAAIAGALMVALHQYISRTAPEAAWADGRYAYHFRRVRSHLIEMRGGTPHPRDWRPHVLALCNDSVDRVRLLTLASWIDGDSGFTTAVRIITPPPGEAAEAVTKAEKTLDAEIEKAGLGTFSRVVSAPSVLDGLRTLLQAHGLGPLYANTLLMSAHEHMGKGAEPSKDAPPTAALIAAMRQGCNLVLMEASKAA